MNIDGHDVYILWLFHQGTQQLWGIYSNVKSAHDDGFSLVQILGADTYYVVEDKTVNGDSVIKWV